MKRKNKTALEELSQGGNLWESGELGESITHARISPQDDEVALDKALGLQLISIRLTKTLIDQLKQLATLEGIGYQPLIRNVLNEYAKDNQHRLDDMPLPTTREGVLQMAEELAELKRALKLKQRSIPAKSKQPEMARSRKRPKS